MSNNERSRVNWKNQDMLKLFLDLCLEEANKRNFSGSSLKKESWERIRAAFKVKKNEDLSQKQLKNQWDYLKKKYQTWVSIIGRTGNTNYDPLTNRINWTDEKWEEEIKLNSDVKQFRYKPLEYPDEMRALFDGLLATGKDAWGPSKEGLPIDGVQTPISLDEGEDMPWSSDVKIKQEKRRKRSSSSDRVEDVEVQLLAAIKTLENSDGPTIGECNKVLDEMKTLEMTYSLYIAASSIFYESKAYREQWIMMHENPEEIRKNWILMNARRLNVI